MVRVEVAGAPAALTATSGEDEALAREVAAPPASNHLAVGDEEAPAHVCFICLEEETVDSAGSASAAAAVLVGLCTCTSLGVHLDCLETLANSGECTPEAMAKRLTCQACQTPFKVNRFVRGEGPAPPRDWLFFLGRCWSATKPLVLFSTVSGGTGIVMYFLFTLNASSRLAFALVVCAVVLSCGACICALNLFQAVIEGRVGSRGAAPGERKVTLTVVTGGDRGENRPAMDAVAHRPPVRPTASSHSTGNGTSAFLADASGRVSPEAGST